MKISLIELNLQIQKVISESSLLRDSSALRSAVDRDSTLSSSRRFANEVELKSHRKKDLEMISIISWFLDEEVGFLIRFKIQEMVSEDSELNVLRILTTSKSLCLAAIAEGLTSFKTPNELFGNCLCKRNFSRFKFLVTLKYLPSRKPTRKEYRRGPTDQGTLGRRGLSEECFRWTTFELEALELKKKESRRRFEEYLNRCNQRLRSESFKAS